MLDPLSCAGLGHVPGTVQVSIDHCIPAFWRNIQRWFGELTAGIVDEYVELTKALPGNVN